MQSAAISEIQAKTGNSIETMQVSYEFLVNFSAIGSFSVNNPIDIELRIRNVSIPNLLDEYQTHQSLIDVSFYFINQIL